MSRPRPANAELYDAFLHGLLELEPRDAEDALAQLSAELASQHAPYALRDRILSKAVLKGRLAHFAERVAALLDIDPLTAQQLLDRVGDSTLFNEPLPGIGFYMVDGGSAVADCIRTFVRVRAGLEFPAHEHLGAETFLVIQGALEDPARGVTVSAGEMQYLPAGSMHAFRVREDGPDLVGISVTHTGLRVRGVELRGGAKLGVRLSAAGIPTIARWLWARFFELRPYKRQA